jgi:hypothetical protein
VPARPFLRKSSTTARWSGVRRHRSFSPMKMRRSPAARVVAIGDHSRSVIVSSARLFTRQRRSSPHMNRSVLVIVPDDDPGERRVYDSSDVTEECLPRPSDAEATVGRDRPHGMGWAV